MESNSIETLLETMETLKNDYMNVKAHFPYMNDTSIGKQTAYTAPYYYNRGFNIKFVFNQPITKAHIKRNNEITGWINQSFIIRLYALMNSHHIISDDINIDKSIDGWIELDLLRRLRHIFTHSSGKFNPNKIEHKKLVNRLVDYFNLDKINYDYFPISIDKVCIPLHDGCKKYIQKK